MIKGVEIKQLTTHPDSRGFFREVIRNSDPFFAGAFGQWSHSMMVQGVIKAWHIHKNQYDFWYVAGGLVRAVVAEIKEPKLGTIEYADLPIGMHYFIEDYQEYLMGDHQPPIVLKIPPGIAHGCKVLQGPAHLLYVTSKEYDPANPDEGRLPFDSLPYDWHAETIS